MCVCFRFEAVDVWGWGGRIPGIRMGGPVSCFRAGSSPLPRILSCPPPMRCVLHCSSLELPGQPLVPSCSVALFSLRNANWRKQTLWNAFLLAFQEKCTVKVLCFCLVNLPDWFIILLPIFHVFLSDDYHYFNVEPRCVSGDIFVYLRALTQGHSKWGVILLPLSPLAPWLGPGSGNSPHVPGAASAPQRWPESAEADGLPQISLHWLPAGLWQGCESGNLHFFPVESQQFPFALESTRIQVSRKLHSVCLCLWFIATDTNGILIL